MLHRMLNSCHTLGTPEGKRKAQRACLQLWPPWRPILLPARQHCEAHEETPQAWHAPDDISLHVIYCCTI